jgi:hypothetical protein
MIKVKTRASIAASLVGAVIMLTPGSGVGPHLADNSGKQAAEKSPPVVIAPAYCASWC